MERVFAELSDEEKAKKLDEGMLASFVSSLVPKRRQVGSLGSDPASLLVPM